MKTKNVKMISMILIFTIICDSSLVSTMNNSSTHPDKQIETEVENLTTLPPIDSAYDNKHHQYIFLFDDSIDVFGNATIIDNFTLAGGSFTADPWKTLSGFAGIINNSATHLGYFLGNVTVESVTEDSSVEAQMNAVQRQLQTYPNLIDQDYYNLQGNSNASLAFIDSGIDDSHIFFQNGYDDKNFSHKIVGWQDYVESSTTPSDTYGHGTAMSAVAAGGGNSANATRHSGSNYYMSVGGDYTHFDLFQPNHVTPGWYRFKLASLDMSGVIGLIKVNGTLQEITTPSQFAGQYRLEIYSDFQTAVLNTSIGTALNVNWNTFNLPGNYYDIYFAYPISLGGNPHFKLMVNITYAPALNLNPLASNTGIAPKTKIVSLKVLNNSGEGFVSDVISALDWVLDNNTEYQIVATVLSLGARSLDSVLADTIANQIDSIIEAGTMVIVPVGNYGDGSETLNDLAISSKALVVGAMNGEDKLTYYSSQGTVLGTGVTRPDVLAPGGSLLRNGQMIITADSDDAYQFGSDPNLDDLTCVSGTSVATSIVAGIYNILVEKAGGFSNWNFTEQEALSLKSLILMTASETGIAKEDNPSTSINEGTITPPINRGTPDIYEGYGRINPAALIDMLNTTFPINDSRFVELSASTSDPTASHIYGETITLEPNQLYYFDIQMDFFQPNLDVDLYLYSNDSNEFGQPIVLASSRTAGQDIDEDFYYTNLNTTRNYYVIAKAVSGQGRFYLSVSAPVNVQPPLLNNTYVEVSSAYNDTLDTYRFWVNYSHPENFPPSYVFLHLSDTAGNITMTPNNVNDVNFTDGAMYYFDHMFKQSGTQTKVYSYYFTTQTGIFFYNYSAGINQQFLITIHSIPNVVPYAYEPDFSLDTDVNKWTGRVDTSFYDMKGTFVLAYGGWNWLTVPNTYENRYTGTTSWQVMYCGLTQLNTITTPLFARVPLTYQNRLVYTYDSLVGLYNLDSPSVFLDENIVNDPQLSMAIRASLNAWDSVILQINANRTGWVPLQLFSDREDEWTVYKYNLSAYINNYVQFRFSGIFTLGVDTEQNKGFMIDWFKVKESAEVNTHTPLISQSAYYVNGNLAQYPYFTTDRNDILGHFAFQVSFTDEDGNLPNYMYLEIGGKNYSMYNTKGVWNTLPPSVGYTGYRGIPFTYNLSLYGKTDTQYRFHTFDGKYRVTSPWYGSILSNPLDGSGALLTPLIQDFKEMEITVFGTPQTISPSIWISPDISWHRVKDLDGIINPHEWYCGEYSYNGYLTNWNTSLILPMMNLNSSNELFLTFESRMTFDNGPAGGDSGELLISTDYGGSWSSLASFESSTGGNFVKQTIELTPLIGTNALFQFNFVSDGYGFQIANSGWRIANFSIDTNRSKDYIPPIINFLTVQDGQVVSEDLILVIQILDNSGIDLNRSQFYINSNLIPMNVTGDIINMTIDTRTYKNGDLIEIAIIVFDLQGNRALKKVILTVDNPMDPKIIWLILVGVIVLIGVVAYNSVRKAKIRALMAAGDYTQALSLRDRLAQERFEREQRSLEAQTVLTRYNKEWEKAQPYILACKACDTWYRASEFEIYCPKCAADALMIVKQCPVCRKWKYFENEGIHRCKRDKIQLLKNYEAAKQEIQERMGDSNYQKTHKMIEEKKEQIKATIQEIPKEEVKRMLLDLIERAEES